MQSLLYPTIHPIPYNVSYTLWNHVYTPCHHSYTHYKSVLYYTNTPVLHAITPIPYNIFFAHFNHCHTLWKYSMQSFLLLLQSYTIKTLAYSPQSLLCPTITLFSLQPSLYSLELLLYPTITPIVTMAYRQPSSPSLQALLVAMLLWYWKDISPFPAPKLSRGSSVPPKKNSA